MKTLGRLFVIVFILGMLVSCNKQNQTDSDDETKFVGIPAGVSVKCSRGSHEGAWTCVGAGRAYLCVGDAWQLDCAPVVARPTPAAEAP